MSDPSIELISEIRVFYNSLVNLGEQLHKESGITLGGRAVLEYLAREGSTTVPRIAESRRVSRQRIQALANELKSSGLVKTKINPSSQRSPLLHLTSAGKNLLRRMTEKESRVLASVTVSDKTCKNLTRQLRLIREQMESGSSQ